MALPSTREEFKGYCLRSLGSPVINIEIDDNQVDDRIDEALKYYWDYHFDGTEKIYYKHMITPTDVTNRYITLPDNIIGAVRVFPVGQPLTGGDMFNIRYQIAMNDLYTLTSQSMVPYYMTMAHLQFMEEILVGQQPIRYNRHTNKLYVDTDWSSSNGQYLVIEAYKVVDPEEYTDAYADRWLLRYATCLIKQQWGNNIKKYTGIRTAGNTVLNGQQIYDEATQERADLEHEMIYTYSPMGDFYIG